ncbi:MAG: carbonic anhydrase, partial [Anaerolineae bacterium]|nr:carbonic anhydrase [Anaerolineae bacterium]
SVIHTDLNCLSVIQYAVDILKVKHIIVCGHYGCSGVRAAMQNESFGLVDYWLRHLKDLYQKHLHTLKKIEDEELRWDRMCELNVVEQVYNVCHTNIIQNAWERGQALSVHGWLYSIKDGLIRNLGVEVNSTEGISKVYHIMQASEQC